MCKVKEDMNKILLLEDDVSLVDGLCYSLKKNGFEVEIVYTVKEALRLLMEMNRFDLLILDVTLPDGTGFEVCEKVRKQNVQIPIIFLTASDEEVNVIRGLDSGGDDYITKPFSILILEKKLNAILNRIALHEPTKTYSDHRLQLNFSSYTAHIDNKLVEFTPLEFQLLELLIQNKGHIVTRQRILDVIWDKRGNYVDESSLNSMICRIRNRIDTKEFHYIKTIYGTGYMWMNQ